MAIATGFGDDGTSLQGTWKVIKAEKAGRTATDSDLEEGLWMTFSGDQWGIKKGQRPGPTAKFRLDPDNPGWIDIVSLWGRREVLLPGIYKLEGDTLQVTLAGSPGARPTKFSTERSTPPGVNDRSYVLKRVQ